jgi:hypothetical protein
MKRVFVEFLVRIQITVELFAAKFLAITKLNFIFNVRLHLCATLKFTARIVTKCQAEFMGAAIKNNELKKFGLGGSINLADFYKSGSINLADGWVN